MARPAFKPTAKQQKMVAVAAGAGMPHEDIAAALGITAPTLRKHFKQELKGGAAMKRIQVLTALHTSAIGGSASAARAYLQNAPADSAVGKQVPVGTEGKKAAANAAAETAAAGTDWEGLMPGTGSDSKVVRMRRR